MIATLTLNPAIDRTLSLQGLTINAVNRVADVSIDAGGKGINASRVIKFFGEDTIILGFAGGTSGNELISMLDANNLNHDFVMTTGATRVNIKLIDTVNHTCTDVNEPGGIVCENELMLVKKKIADYATKSNALIFSGSAPKGVPRTIYKDLINEMKKINSKIVLDASGDLLKEGLKAVPWLVKPNLDELSEILGFKPKNATEVISGCRQLIETGIKYVCVSMGADGLTLVGPKSTVSAIPPKIAVQSTVGAGDAVTGSLATLLSQGIEPHEALRSACAISAGSVTLPGTGIPNRDLYNKLYEEVIVFS